MLITIITDDTRHETVLLLFPGDPPDTGTRSRQELKHSDPNIGQDLWPTDNRDLSFEKN